MLYLSEVAAGILWQSIHFLLPQLLRPARRSLLHRASVSVALERVNRHALQEAPVVPWEIWLFAASPWRRASDIARFWKNMDSAAITVNLHAISETSVPSFLLLSWLSLNFSMAAKRNAPRPQSQSPPPLPFILTYLFRSSPLQGTEGIFGGSRWVIIHVRAAVTAEKLSLLKSDAVSDI